MGQDPALQVVIELPLHERGHPSPRGPRLGQERVDVFLHRSIQRCLLRSPTLVGAPGPGRSGHGEKPEQPPGPRAASGPILRTTRTSDPACLPPFDHGVPLLCEHLPPALSRAAVGRPAVAGGLDDTAGRSRQRSTSSGVKAETLTGFGTFNDPVAWDLTEGKVNGGSSWSASFALEDPALTAPPPALPAAPMSTGRPPSATERKSRRSSSRLVPGRAPSRRKPGGRRDGPSARMGAPWARLLSCLCAPSRSDSPA